MGVLQFTLHDIVLFVLVFVFFLFLCLIVSTFGCPDNINVSRGNYSSFRWAVRMRINFLRIHKHNTTVYIIRVCYIAYSNPHTLECVLYGECVTIHYMSFCLYWRENSPHCYHLRILCISSAYSWHDWLNIIMILSGQTLPYSMYAIYFMTDWLTNFKFNVQF